MIRKTISIITPCYNEQENVAEVYQRVKDVMRQLVRYNYEHIFIDNASSDGTVAVLRRLAGADSNVKVIVNSRNFGAIRSSMHALFQTRGDAVIGLVADLQDPPELIAELVKKWEDGYAMVLCVKKTSHENPLMFWVRTTYYRIIRKLSSIDTFDNFTGFGLYDRSVVDVIEQFDDPYPYFRGMIAEIGLPYCLVEYDQPVRKHGKSSNNFYTLYELAMLGITKLSKVPLRFVTFTGFVSSLLCILVALVYFIYKILFWSRFSAGAAPIVIGLFFFSSVQLLSLGIIGEYLATVLTHVQKRPYVVERERINFDVQPDIVYSRGRKSNFR
jgi:polyisoprenyl-phosphate glycosyltransferase